MPSAVSLSFRHLVVFGLGGIIPIALFNIAGQLMGLIGNISLGLSAFWLGVILIIPRLWDAISDPIVGHLSDRTRTPWGRRRPFILIGGIAVAISFVLLWWVPQGELVRTLFPSESAFQWFQLSYILVLLLIFFTACTLFEIPHGALGMEMTSHPHERTRLFSAKSFFGNLFAMGTPWLFALAGMEVFKGQSGTEVDGMKYVSLIVAAILIPVSIWWFIELRENPIQPPISKQAKDRSSFWLDMKRTNSNKSFIYLVAIVFTLAMGFNFVSLLNYYISIFYLYGGDKSAAGMLLGVNGTVWAITGLLAVFPLNWISPRIGKLRTLVLAILMMGMAQFAKIFCYNPDYPYLVLIPTILLSSGMLFFFTLGSSMVGDICDEEELLTGQRMEGSYYSVYWWYIKMGSAFASLVTGTLIVFSQFDEVQVTQVDKLRSHIKTIEAGLNTGNEKKPIVIDEAKKSIELLHHHFIQKAESSHQKMLLHKLEEIDVLLTSMDSKNFLKNIPQTEVALNKLALQSPETLFRLRAVEIGLPILLGLISLLIALKYPLTDLRNQEIHAALQKKQSSAYRIRS